MVETVDTLGGTDVDRCQQQWRGFCSLLQDACRRHWESSVSLFGAESPLAIWAEELCQSNLPPSFAKTLRSVRNCLVFSNEELTSQRLLSSLGKRAILVISCGSVGYRSRGPQSCAEHFEAGGTEPPEPRSKLWETPLQRLPPGANDPRDVLLEASVLSSVWVIMVIEFRHISPCFTSLFPLAFESRD